MISLCNGALTAAGTGADKEAKRKKISEMCVGLTPKVMTSCMNTREALAKTINGGGKRRGSKKASKGKKAQRGGARCPDGSAPAKVGEGNKYDAQGNPMCKTASGEWVPMVFTGNEPTGVSAELQAARANLRPTGRSLTGGKRGSKKASKGKKAQRGGGQCEDFYGADTTKVARCNAIMNFDASKQKKEDLRQPCSAEGLKQPEINACMRKALSGGKRGSKKASKGSRKH